MKFKLEWEIEVDDSELLEMVNDYLSDEDKQEVDSLDQVSGKIMINAMDSIDFIQTELNDYCARNEVDITLIK